jgi:RNA polymerase sigma-32 factor
MAANNSNRKLFFGLRKIKNALGLDTLSDQDANLIAQKMQVTKEEVLASDHRFSSKDFSTNSPMGEDGSSSFQDFLADTSASHEDLALEKQEYEYRKKVLHDALNTLSERERNIVISYRLANPPKSLRTIAGEIGVSAERIRQIEISAFLKIQKYVRSVA